MDSETGQSVSDASGDRHRPYARRTHFKGVSKHGDSWRAMVFRRGTVKDLGFFCTEEAAARGIDKDMLAFALKNPRAPPPELNFPDSVLSDDDHEEECIVGGMRGAYSL